MFFLNSALVLIDHFPVSSSFRSCPLRNRFPPTSLPPSRWGNPARPSPCPSPTPTPSPSPSPSPSRPQPPSKDARPQTPRCLRPPLPRPLSTPPPSPCSTGTASRTPPALGAASPTWAPACPAPRSTCLTRSPRRAWPRTSLCPSPRWSCSNGFVSCRSKWQKLFSLVLQSSSFYFSGFYWPHFRELVLLLIFIN